MKLIKYTTLAAAVALSLSSTAHAKGTVVAKVGLLGAGVEYVHPINDKFAVSGGINGLSYSDEITESDIDFDADLKMNTFSLLGDYHPWGNGFRLSAGVMHNGNEFDLTGTPSAANNETVDINGTTYTAADVGSLTANIGFKSIAPYLGIGWGHAPKAGKGWAFDAEVGVLFQGNPETSFTVICSDALSTADCATLQSDADAEEASIDADAQDFDMFPVVSLGVSYRF